jgi:hypothetical protein
MVKWIQLASCTHTRCSTQTPVCSVAGSYTSILYGPQVTHFFTVINFFSEITEVTSEN